MKIFYVVNVSLVLEIVVTLAASPDVQPYTSLTREYCMESFSPTCSKNEVIIMQVAKYGRMNLGRCVKKDYGNLGCSSNELQTLDKMCSGLTSCQLNIPSPELTAKLPCLEELNPYLEAGFECQKAYIPDKPLCRMPERVHVPSAAGYIGSKTSKDTNCGLHETPWVLEALPGQKINITLIDFDWNNSTNGNRYICNVNYGYILDLENDDVINICGGGKRIKQVFQSVGHKIQIVLNAENVKNYKYLLKYQATGCPQYRPPRYSWVKEEGNGLLIGCEFSSTTWKLHCAGTFWLGDTGNCSAPPATNHNGVNGKEFTSKAPEPAQPINESSTSSVTHNHVVAFALGCVTVVACCVVVFFGIYCIRRHEIQAFKENDYSLPPTLRRPEDNHSVSNYAHYSVLSTGETVPVPVSNTATANRDLPPYPNTTLPSPQERILPRVVSRQRLHSYNADGSVVVTTVGGDKHIYMSPNHPENPRVFYHVLENPLESSRGRSRLASDGDSSIGGDPANLGASTSQRSNSVAEQLYQSINNFNTIV